MNNNYSVGNIQPEWNDGMAQTLTFIVTEDCNLTCMNYCTFACKGTSTKSTRPSAISTKN